MLGSHMFDSFDDRCRFVQASLEAKAKPVLWSQAEIRELDYVLGSAVQVCRRRLMLLRMRADWYGGPDYVRNIENLEWEPKVKARAEYRDYFKHTLALIVEHFSTWSSGR